jgi:hypothetical protein
MAEPPEQIVRERGAAKPVDHPAQAAAHHAAYDQVRGRQRLHHLHAEVPMQSRLPQQQITERARSTLTLCAALGGARHVLERQLNVVLLLAARTRHAATDN